MTNEPNVYRPRRTVDLSNPGEVIKGVTTEGWVSRPTWNANDSAARSKEIEEAREQALKDYEQQIANLNPLAARVSALETAVKQLSNQLDNNTKQIKELLDNA